MVPSASLRCTIVAELVDVHQDLQDGVLLALWEQLDTEAGDAFLRLRSYNVRLKGALDSFGPSIESRNVCT